MNNIRVFDAKLAYKLEDINAAVIVNQIDYWLKKENVGVTIEGVKWIYNSFEQWIKDQFKWLSSWEFRKSLKKLRDLGIVLVKRHKAKQWNQTNYYTLDYEALNKFLEDEKAESTETVDLCVLTDPDIDIQQIEMRDRDISYIDTKNTSKEKTTKQNIAVASKDTFPKLENVSKVTQKQSQEPEKPEVKSTPTSSSEPKEQFFVTCSTKKAQNIPKIRIKNQNWRSHLEKLDSIGVSINQTVKNMVKMYSTQEVEAAIALLVVRKRDKYIGNPAGYFLQALKEKWSKSSLKIDNAEDDNQIDFQTVFRLWYDRMKALGHVTGQEIRDGIQYVFKSGAWERFQEVWDKGWTLEYLDKLQKSR